MRKIFLLASIAALSIAGSASALELKFSGGLGGGAVIGGSGDLSGAGGFTGTSEFGGGKAKAQQDAYGQSESSFKGGWKADNNGSSYQMQGKTLTGSGSLSQVGLSSKGNGSASGVAVGGGFGAGGSAGLGGAGQIGIKN